MTKNQAARIVRDNANALIEQLERIAKGWDRGMYRADSLAWECRPANSIRNRIKGYVSESFELSAQFADAPTVEAANENERAPLVDRSRLVAMREAFERDGFARFPLSETATDIEALLHSAEVNADDTIFAECAAPLTEWNSLFLGTLRSELSCGDWSRGCVEWFASQGVTA